MSTQLIAPSTDTGLFGPRGWTTEKQIHLILGEHRRPRVTNETHTTTQPPELADYEPVNEIQADTARQLLATLPTANLQDRQNHGPTVQELLELAVKNPAEIQVYGYAIGPSRPDERLSLEGFTYYPTQQTDLDELAHWETLANKLDIKSHQAPPDAIHLVGRVNRPGIWVWWD